MASVDCDALRPTLAVSTRFDRAPHGNATSIADLSVVGKFDIYVPFATLDHLVSHRCDIRNADDSHRRSDLTAAVGLPSDSREVSQRLTARYVVVTGNRAQPRTLDVRALVALP